MMKLRKGQALVLVAVPKGGKSEMLESAANEFDGLELDVLYLDGERTRESIGFGEDSPVRVKCCAPSTPLSDALAGEKFDVLVIDCLDLFTGAGVSTASEIAQRHDCIVITAKQAPQYEVDECPACDGPCEFPPEDL